MTLFLLAFLFSMNSITMERPHRPTYRSYNTKNHGQFYKTASASLIIFRKTKHGCQLLVGQKGLINYHIYPNISGTSVKQLIKNTVLRPALRPTFLGGKVQYGETPRQAALREFFEESFLNKKYPNISYKKLAEEIDLPLILLSKPYKNKKNNFVVSNYYLLNINDLAKKGIIINKELINKTINQYFCEAPEILSVHWVNNKKLVEYFSQSTNLKSSEILKLKNLVSKKFPYATNINKNIFDVLNKQEYRFKIVLARQISQKISSSRK